MAHSTRKALKLVTAFIFISMLSSCFATRKKNRCGDCPKWKIEFVDFFFK